MQSCQSCTRHSVLACSKYRYNISNGCGAMLRKRIVDAHHSRPPTFIILITSFFLRKTWLKIDLTAVLITVAERPPVWKELFILSTIRAFRKCISICLRIGWLVGWLFPFETIFQSISGRLPKRGRKRRKDR